MSSDESGSGPHHPDRQQPFPSAPNRETLRREYLVHICEALATYLRDGHHATVTRVGDGEAFERLPEVLDERSGVVFAIDDWEAFVDYLEPESRRIRRSEHNGRSADER